MSYRSNSCEYVASANAKFSMVSSGCLGLRYDKVFYGINLNWFPTFHYI